VLTIAATTRHLTASGARTLCGKAIDLATAVRQATFYSYADCGACARLAKAQARICPVCGSRSSRSTPMGSARSVRRHGRGGGDRLVTHNAGAMQTFQHLLAAS